METVSEQKDVAEQVKGNEGERAEVENGLLKKDPQVLLSAARAIVEDNKVKEISRYKDIAEARVDPEGRRQYPEKPSLSMPEEKRRMYEDAVSFVASNLRELYPDIFRTRGQIPDIRHNVSGLKRGLEVLNVLTNFAEKGSGKVPENWRPSADMVRAIEGEEGNK